MGLTITHNTKKGAKPASAALHDSQLDVTAQPVVPDAVQEYLDLQLKLEKHDAKVASDRKRFEALHKQFVAVVDETCDAETTIVLQGLSDKGKRVEISQKSEQTTITDLEQAKKELGTKTFMAVAKITLTDLRAYLTPPQLAQVTKTERTGSRRLKIID